MGMMHDGKNNNCSPTCCLMSYISGGGKTTWSSCSIKEFHRFLKQLGHNPNYPKNCMLDHQNLVTNYDGLVNGGIMPGQRYTADQQCKLTHGKCYHMDLKDGTLQDSVCSMLYCSSDDGFIYSAEPALDGTYCGNGKWCVDGQCQPWRSATRPLPVFGQWNSWSDSLSNSCNGGQCSSCQIRNQLRVRRVSRSCDSPAPDNGGKSCPGSAYRGIICDKSPCSGVSPDEYATRNCTNLLNQKIVPEKLSTNGKGAQQEEDPCKVWCQTAPNSDYFWTLHSFPDGTPCGSNKYCLAGECLVLACNPNLLVSSNSDCPPTTQTTGQIAQRVVSPSIQGSVSSWSEWSAWSSCSVSCGIGTVTRDRRCNRVNNQSPSCQGSGSESNTCQNGLCPSPGAGFFRIGGSGGTTMKPLPRRNETHQSDGRFDDSPVLNWSQWSQCSVPCGDGQQKRAMRCEKCPWPVTDTRSCFLRPYKTTKIL
uniref:Peptidase M12B domain-containing protein n=1 Tax=Romanomermis culicivorax TaxID=13658 RepID=A0A915L409_ROMCU